MADPITLAGFEAKFAADPDPWNTFADRDEAIKREAILHALGETRGRVLELACGNGSNTVALARRALRLVATDGAPSAVALTRKRVASDPRVQVRLARLPDVPRGPFHAAVIAEVLYYLPEADIARLGVRLARELGPGASLVLAHHTVDFPDTACRPATVHARLVGALRLAGRNPGLVETFQLTRRWRVERVALDHSR